MKSNPMRGTLKIQMHVVTKETDNGQGFTGKTVTLATIHGIEHELRHQAFLTWCGMNPKLAEANPHALWSYTEYI
jgi:hypothetical protein